MTKPKGSTDAFDRFPAELVKGCVYHAESADTGWGGCVWGGTLSHAEIKSRKKLNGEIVDVKVNFIEDNGHEAFRIDERGSYTVDLSNRTIEVFGYWGAKYTIFLRPEAAFPENNIAQKVASLRSKWPRSKVTSTG